MSRPRMSNFVAGVLALAIIIGGCYWAFGGQMPWTDEYEIHAIVRNSPELHSRSPVRVAGVDVGRVTATERGEGDTARITLALNDSAPEIHSDAELKIRPRTFLEGNFFVDLDPGTPGAPPMEEGATIPVGATAGPVLLQDVGSPLVLVAPVGTDLRKPTRQALKQMVRALRGSLEDGGAEGLHDSFEPAAPAFLNLAVVAEAMRGENEGDLGRAVDSTGRVARAMPERQLADLLTGFSRTARALASEREALGRSAPALDALVSTARPKLARINAALPPTRAFAIEARPGVQRLPEALDPAPAFLAQADAVLDPAELPALIDVLDPALAELAQLAPGLEETFELTTPVMECLSDNAIPTLVDRIEDPPLTTGDPVYRELLHSLVGQGSEGQNFDGNGTAVRYHVGFGDRTVTLQPQRGEPIVGLTSEPILGSRPRYTGELPPFRPDVPCNSQEPPDLRAETGPAPPQGRADAAGLRRGRDRLGRALERGLTR